MSYKIAIASSDGKNIDLTFGEARAFDIYEAAGKEYHLSETRFFSDVEVQKQESRGDIGSCGIGGGCGAGGGCASSPKVELILDCRCIVCRKAGFGIIKQLEKKSIALFDVSCGVDEALTKITDYYAK